MSSGFDIKSVSRGDTMREERAIPMQIKVPKELHEQLKQAAKSERRSMANFILTAIESRINSSPSLTDPRTWLPPGVRR
jgi:hypothetical protein